MHEASTAFAIDVCAWSIMSNHYHVVLHINIDQAQSWSMDEIIKRWHQLYGGFALSQRYLSGNSPSKAELATLNERAEIWREHLMNVSWLMRTVNEHIVRQANAEDQCTGRFRGRFLLLQNRHTIRPVYKDRFKLQALLDGPALAACMATNINMGRPKPGMRRHGSNTGKLRPYQY